MKLSVANNKAIFGELDVVVKNDSLKKKCGYLLEYGEEKKVFNSVMTDADLMLELQKFYPK